MKSWQHRRAGLLQEVYDVVAADFPYLSITEGDAVAVEGLLQVVGDAAADFYQIRILFPPDYPRTPPAVYETGGRARGVVKKYGCDFIDLHYFGDGGRACLCHDLEYRKYIRPKAPFATFMTELVLPFFYSQAVFERDRIWPFEERSHGAEGTFEAYADFFELQDVELLTACVELIAGTRRAKRSEVCLCGSGKSLVECHPSLLAKVNEARRLVTPEQARFHASQMGPFRDEVRRRRLQREQMNHIRSLLGL